MGLRSFVLSKLYFSIFMPMRDYHKCVCVILKFIDFVCCAKLCSIFFIKSINELPMVARLAWKYSFGIKLGFQFKIYIGLLRHRWYAFMIFEIKK